MLGLIEQKNELTVPASKRPPYRIALVGCGPKGMYCLERLIHRINLFDSHSEIQIILFEPEKYPGAGPIYHPDQPHYLRMNYASGMIDTWSEIPTPREKDVYPDLVHWLQRYYPEMADPNGVIPRAVTGEYLIDCYHKILQSCPDFCSIEHRQQKVIDLKRSHGRWILKTDTTSESYDEVLISIGHEGWRSASDDQDQSETVLPHVFPVTEMLSEQRIPAGASVAVRGFALTFIDACLALTEGRGGSFSCHAGKWKYQRSGEEAGCILPFSRSGRPMFPKPDYQQLALPGQLETIWEQGRSRLMHLEQPEQGLEFETMIWPVLLQTAAKALVLVNPQQFPQIKSTAKQLASWYALWISSTCSADEVYVLLTRAYGVATGRERPDEIWALGEAFRQLYSTLVRRISHGGLSDSSWDGFSKCAIEMERLAFGPPAENTGRMLALMEAGLINLEFLNGNMIQNGTTLKLKQQNRVLEVDRLVHAVIPHCQQFAEGSILSKLISSGWARQMKGAGAIDINRSGRPVAENGAVTRGLAVIGRATEGCVLGNDTLTRQLHKHPDQWARSVCRHIQQR
ncbi:FAD/NAD(P)-binding protein [Gimesia sp.]|uniref:FAD/NAD(P)-binding protein n=1 Tax=Gimesia sp. TaxID=2024833 RepID=UPI003A925B32